MIAFLANVALVVGAIALVAIGGLIGRLAERAENRIPFNSGRGKRR